MDRSCQPGDGPLRALGIGKSSIKNMMLEHLQRKGLDAPKVVEFNPWQWAAQNELAEAFFREISLALVKKDQTKDAKKRAATFAAYAAYLELGKHLITGVRPLLPTVLALAGILGISAGYVERALWLKPYVKLAGVAALVLAALTGWSAEFAEKAATAPGESGPREVWYLQLQAVEKFVDPAVLKNQFDKLKPQVQSESHVRAVRAFEQALERRRSGKPGGGTGSPKGKTHRVHSY